jgi:hypothetical protein
MSKLLFILVAAFAIVAAAHSAPLEFQHLEDSDADLLLADEADELDLNDDLGQNDEFDKQADELESDSETDESCSLMYIWDTETSRCKQCPQGQTTSYGVQDGKNCSSCAERYMLDPTGVCNNALLNRQTLAQKGLVFGLEAVQIPQETIAENGFPANVQSYSHLREVISSAEEQYQIVDVQSQQIFRSNFREETNKFNCGGGKDQFSRLIVNRCNRFLEIERNDPSIDLQTKSCPVGKTCCLQGWYGDHPNCIQCPSSAPSSPRTANGGPDSNCNCPNAASSSCFACSNVCRPFNVATGICTPICSTCKVVTIGGVKKPSNC